MASAHIGFAIRYARALGRRRRPELADEAVALGGFVLAEAIRSYDPATVPDFLSHLKVLLAWRVEDALNKFLHRYRGRKSRLPEIHTGLLREDGSCSVPEGFTPARPDLREQEEGWDYAVFGLSPDERRMLTLVFVESHSAAEASTLMGLSRMQGYRLYQRALRRVKERHIALSEGPCRRPGCCGRSSARACA